jgi:lipoprotein-anchoring transpeptidase ErfK/SrfK
MAVKRVIASLVLLTFTPGMFGCALFSPPPPPPPPPVVEVKKPEPYLVLRLGERRLYVKEDGSTAPEESYRVAIGRAQFPTPTGKFQINEMVENPDFLVFDFNKPDRPSRGRIPPGPHNPLGLRWIAFAHAHGWTIGFHGTAKTSVLGQAVSHGCVRMANEDIIKVYRRVKLGTTVIVEP